MAKHNKAIQELKAATRKNARLINGNMKNIATEVKNREDGDKKVLKDANVYTDRRTNKAIDKARDKSPDMFEQIGDFFSDVWNGITKGPGELFKIITRILPTLAKGLLIAGAVCLCFVTLYVLIKLTVPLCDTLICRVCTGLGKLLTHITNGLKSSMKENSRQIPRITNRMLS